MDYSSEAQLTALARQGLAQALSIFKHMPFLGGPRAARVPPKRV